MPALSPILARIRAHDPAIECLSLHPVSGGCIHRSFVLQGQRHHQPWRGFLKVNEAPAHASLAAEAHGLQTLANAIAAVPDNPLRVPQPLLTDKVEGMAFLLMDYLPLGSKKRADSEKKLARGLFLLHQHQPPGGRFGLERDNFIGTTPQKNAWETDWVKFFGTHRLGYQFELALKNGYADVHAAGLKVLEKLPEYLRNHRPQSGLLHGDLWSGNAGYLEDGTPAVFDPAVYYGDRETDLAMMEMFGGFSPLFFTAYRDYAEREGMPVPASSDPAFQRRKHLYQLYHWLNHLNLFGNAYLPQVQRSLREIDSLRT